MSTPLARRIKSLIRLNGPLSVTDFFSLCLADPEHGYYKTRQPFGRTGDFVTAPEVSQLFGEMIGVFIVHAWQRHGTPANARLVEIGPGRGTMMADMLRVIQRIAPPLYETMSVHLVETSPRLTDTQKETLASHGDKIAWHESFDDVPPGFLLIAANELFDAIPIRQFVKTPQGFRERVVALNAEDELVFTTGLASIDPELLPPLPERQPTGTIFEYSPAREAVMTAISQRLKINEGTALIIDYGHIVSGYGDTLQAMRMHEFDPVLASPGEADLTSHVDFESLVNTAENNGIHVNGCLRQGDFLYGLGLKERATALAAKATPDQTLAIAEAVNRLAGEGAGKMGELFKVLAVSSSPVHLLPFRALD
ncbi:class I SAM-dependent methyltransferase [Agrobacterium sp. rho-13.3]|uniref:class I SAM-dependent methyltransferase n=1 Tax=Agrobacterium sp. rho-13.3 TaxID=3072980 RepID=UPI002A102984|nr:class I SAM-dependent methyltransferase [Agrobacterium sp. rho-13.3]MDX8308044.1 class I SAM-dependent methyltransferase [Agrobacterium sp. rho-13.3]